MSNGVPKKHVREMQNSHNKKSSNGDLGCLFAGFSLFAIPGLIVYFNAHLKQLEISLKYAVGIILLIVFIKIFKVLKENIMMHPDEKEFAKLTVSLRNDQFIALKIYFKTTNTDFQSANKFLKSCRGIAFLEAYKKFENIDNISISKLILDVEREEQIISCAVDVLKTYSQL